MSLKKYYIFSAIIVIIDQLLKGVAIKNFSYVTNTGAAWGILKNSQVFLVVISIIAILVIIRYLKTYPLELSFILGGTIGNLIDRIFRHHVIDFINIRVFNYPLFNVADIFIVAGAILIGIKIFTRD
ncbi:MAG: signal peptidase II [Nanoarchaeota archaeon]|nr:signal peptidase II [Nanoarchaeota archaeon]